MRPPRRFSPPISSSAFDADLRPGPPQPTNLPSSPPLPRGLLDLSTWRKPASAFRPASLPRGLLDPAGVPARSPARPASASALEGASSEDRLYGEEGGDQLAPIPPHKPVNAKPEWVPIVPNMQWRLRGKDAWGDGSFWASRKDADGSRRPHLGLDVAVDPSTPVLAPASGKIANISSAYTNPANDPSGGRLKAIKIELDDGYLVKLIYVVPRSGLKIGDVVQAGEQVGVSDDMTSGRKGMTNHLHIEFPWGKKNAHDPTSWVLSWIKRHHDD